MMSVVFGCRSGRIGLPVRLLRQGMGRSYSDVRCPRIEFLERPRVSPVLALTPP